MLQTDRLIRGRYRLETQLGHTAAGRQTWLARDERGGDRAVLKLLAFSPQVSWDEVRLFEREA